MASPVHNNNEEDVIEGRFYAKFQCNSAVETHTWISITAGKNRNKKRICNKHGNERVKARAIEHRPLKKKDIPDERRLFGKFECLSCQHDWASAHAWKNSSQKCTKCKEPVITWDLYYLKRGNQQQGEIAHHVSECSKCEEVGDCRLYHPHTK